jgi:hypothetical protein
MSLPRRLLSAVARIAPPSIAAAAMLAGPPLAPAPLAAQTTGSADAAPLEFMGFRAGATLSDVTTRVDSGDGGHLRCDRSRVDARVTECRATLADPDLGGPVELWLSAIDGVTGVMTLAGDVTPDQLDAWRARLERQYGRVGARVQGTQWMMQWVRHGRMLRLTWRVAQGDRTASVSLVDGHVLDAWQPARSPSARGSR